jgi:hypothetical protein
LYLAGQRVPIKGISLSGSENNHIQATLSIPPNPLVKNLKPRTVVHVFSKEALDDEFLLLFEGEYTAYRDVEETGSKNFEMHCTGLTNYWETTYQFFINHLSPASIGQNEIASFVSGGEVGEGARVTSVNITLPRQFGNYVTQALLRNGNDIQQSMLDVVHLMANMSGGQNGNVLEPRINSQIEKAFVNLRLGERVFVLPDEAIKKLINLRLARELMSQMAGQLSDFSTLGKVITTFLNFVHYDWIPMVSPSFTARNTVAPTGTGSALDFVTPIQFGSDTSSSPRATTSSIVDTVGLDPNFGATEGSSRSRMSSANVQRDVIFKPKTHFLPPPTCNLVFPSMYDRLASGRFFLQEPTRLRLRTQPIPSLGEKNVFNTFSYYAPKEILRALEREKKTSPEQVRSVDKQTNQATGAQPVIPQDNIVKRYETLIVQEGSGAIDETLTGVLPSFDELGFAEYGAIALDAFGGRTQTSSLVRSQAHIENTSSENNLSEENRRREKLGRANDTPIDELNPGQERDLHQYFSNVAQYRLDLNRAKTRSVESITGPYNPFLALGFPAMVFTRTGIYAGTIVALNHNADAGGTAFTTFTLGLVRDISVVPGIQIASLRELAILETALVLLGQQSSDPTLAKYQEIVSDVSLDVALSIGGSRLDNQRIQLLTNGFDPIDRAPVQPEWLSEDYTPENIGSNVYAPLFGERFPGQRVESLLEVAKITKNQVLAANAMLIRYVMSNNKTAFTRELGRRSIATSTQVLGEFLGVGTPSEDVPERRAGLVQEDLISDQILGQPVEAEKLNAEETIIDPHVPFPLKRVKPVREYVKFLAESKGKGFRG